MERVHDLVIVGGGPAGLQAAIFAESERVDTLVVESSTSLGGQAATSSFIENYGGFPAGISGRDLMSRFIDQALRFDTEFAGPTKVNLIERADEEVFRVGADNSDQFFGRAVLIACGVDFRVLKSRNLSAFLGRGANYGSPPLNVSYENKRVIIIGGANSAGQAACHLAQFNDCDIQMFIRGDSIERGMSGYLIDKINSFENIKVMVNTELEEVNGFGKVEVARFRQSGIEDVQECEADEVFVMIGSEPRTLWLPDSEFSKDRRGFVIAGADHNEDTRAKFIEQTDGRSPLGHETSVPGVFVAGDVRCGTDKRVALAAGDGAGVIPDLHRYRSHITK